MTPASDIEWIKETIMRQVDTSIERLGIQASGDAKLMDHGKAVASQLISKIDVSTVLGMYYHIVEQSIDKETWTSSPDRLQCVYDYFNQWVELELAKRYA